MRDHIGNDLEADITGDGNTDFAANFTNTTNWFSEKTSLSKQRSGAQLMTAGPQPSSLQLRQPAITRADTLRMN